MVKKQDKELADETIQNYVNIQKNLMNEKRIRILILLRNQPTTWSQLMQEADIRNPKLLHDHISLLTSSDLIRKNEAGFYYITEMGKMFLESNISQMNKLAQLKDASME